MYQDEPFGPYSPPQDHICCCGILDDLKRIVDLMATLRLKFGPLITEEQTQIAIRNMLDQQITVAIRNLDNDVN